MIAVQSGQLFKFLKKFYNTVPSFPASPNNSNFVYCSASLFVRQILLINNFSKPVVRIFDFWPNDAQEKTRHITGRDIMGLSVIGAGFGRTGTESMKMALEILGFGPCHHMKVALSIPEQEKIWRVAAHGTLPEWDQVYEGYGSGVDWPTAYYWRELSAHYPEAKILLTVRDAESWYASIAKTILQVINNLTDPDSIGLKMISEGVFENRLHDPGHTIGLYKKHNAAVRSAIPPERLLVYNLGDGWNPLCEFLDVPVPDQSYPKSNTGEEFHEFFDKRLATQD